MQTLGLLCIILSSIGFSDDFKPSEEHWIRIVNYNHYGLGYGKERANVWSLIIVCVCFTTSGVFLFLLLTTQGAVERWKAWVHILIPLNLAI